MARRIKAAVTIKNKDFLEEVSSPRLPKKRASQKYPQPVRTDNFTFKNQCIPAPGAQQDYWNNLNNCDITFCHGPAGTGKTWLVTRYALEQLLNHQIDKIVVTKPILEAGSEKIGHLPGEVEAKVLPHFQSILDCIEDHVGPTMAKKLLAAGQIEFLPLAYARGRTLKNAFILADECQNMTRKGIKLMLSRIAEGSTMCLNGDTDQCDLPNEKDSGMKWAVDCLAHKHEQIGVTEMSINDIKRHPLIGVMLTHLK